MVGNVSPLLQNENKKNTFISYKIHIKGLNTIENEKKIIKANRAQGIL